ncbi:MAG: membrane dipeptidase [Firmicutes bacterium]|nr:membrane dipeptidase [Bacillota bacterium]
MIHAIDMHCDTIMKGIFSELTGEGPADLMKMPGMVDFERLIRGNAMAQFFAVFLPSPEGWKRRGLELDDWTYIEKGTEIFNRSVAAHSDIVAPARNANDIRRNWLNGKLSAVLTMEDGRAVQGKLENLKKLYDDGYRALSIIWNNENCFAYPNAWAEADMMKGLKPFGKEAVQYMQELGILVDTYHLNFGGFDDLCDILTKPFVATHSNAMALSPHKRNLDDSRLKKLAAKGGCTGLNFGPEFLNEDTYGPDKTTADHNSTAARLAQHARHSVDVAGVDTVAIGTDFDGIGGNLEIPSCDKMYILEAALKKEGFTEAEIDKIGYRNVLRVMDEAVK